MKNPTLPWALTLLFLQFISCTDNIVVPTIGDGIDVTEVIAYADGDNLSTKTGLVDDASGKKNVVWKAGNAISLFFNSGENGGDKFTTATSGSVAKFTGTISAVSGDLSDTGGKAYFWGLYPYNANASCDGSAITTTLPASQKAYQGDLADDLLVTVGRSENLAIYFKNTCAVIAFTLSQDNISKVTFRGRNNEKVAGEFKSSFGSGNKLTITPTDNAVEAISVTPAESATFIKGKTYYFAILPQNFASGYTLTFTKNDETVASYERTTSFNFAISTFYTMTNKDSGLTFALVSEAVDLGLSVKWATYNLGASSPEGLGNYYAWGETTTKSSFSESNYRFYQNGDDYYISKYSTPNEYGYNMGLPPDYNNVLDPEDDAATVALGSGWRIPTKEEFNELLENCTWTPAEINGVKGYRVKSNVSGYTDKSIFMPSDENSNGDGIYWTSVLACTAHGATSNYPNSAWTFDVMRNDSYGDKYGFIGTFRLRDFGFLVRPVYGTPAKDAVAGISLNATNLTLHKGETSQLIATTLPADAEYDGMEWSATTRWVSVTDDGLITAINEGTGYVYVTVGAISKQCTVTIEASSIPANCHILNTGAEAYIPLTKGNSTTSVGRVNAVEVLWESFSTDTQPSVGDVIAEVEHRGGVFFVKAGSNEGNAVVAAKDINDKILWSWHIWVTNDPVKEATYSNNAGIMMDRNVGSLKRYDGWYDSGLLYQWGRKDPFLSDWTDFYDFMASTITWPTPVLKNEGGTIEYAIQHPTTKICTSSSDHGMSYPYNGDWLLVSDNSLWGESKTIYDPCPSGWKLPKGGPEGVWAVAGFPSGSYGRGSYTSLSGGTSYQATSGYDEGGHGTYWSYLVVNEGDGKYAYALHFSWYWDDDADDYYSSSPSANIDKARLGAVRCIRDQ